MAKRNHFNKADIKLVQDFVNTIDKDIVIKKGRRFEVDVAEEEIFLGNKRFDRVSQLLMNWLYSKTKVNVNWLVLSILHEVGHIMTDTEELQDQRETLNAIYSFMYEQEVITETEYFISYFEIPAEYNATMWGLNYYLNNSQKCQELAKMLGQTM